MADYKKKKVSKKVPIQKVSKENRAESITMRSSKKQISKSYREQSARTEFQLIRGRKSEVRLSVVLSLVVAIVLVSVYLIILVFHPIGVTEYFSSLYKTIGSGDVYTTQLKGEDIIGGIRSSDYYYLMTDKRVECINNSGKAISSINHGFAKPVMKAAETRYLVYGQGEQTVKIFNFENEISNLHYDKKILCADIADNGNFAVATYADGYDSVVRVYNKNEKILYEWYSSDGIVSSVSLTLNDQIIVATLTADNGAFNTKLRLFNFGSADPETSFVFENDLIYGIYHLSKNNICVISENHMRFINLKDGTVRSEETEYTYKMADHFEKNLTVLSSLSANTDKNHIAVYNSKGASTASFAVDFPVNYIAYGPDYMYILSDSVVHQLDMSGSVICTASVPFDTKVIVPISEKYIVAVNGSSISKILCEQGE